MIKFEKVSFGQFKADCQKLGYNYGEIRLRAIYNFIKLPKRSTENSAGYDFVTPFSIDLGLFKKTVTVPTGIRVIMPKNDVLLLAPRSGLGFKTGMRLANTLGVIDSDYYQADNEGHIMAKIEKGFSSLHVKQGERIMQGIIVKFDITDDDNTTASRTGGLGSTGK